MHDERRLIFCNLLNGNTLDQVARAYHKTPNEIDDIFRLIARKVKSYCFERAYPFIACDTLPEATQNRRQIMHVLDRLNLDKEPKFNKIITHAHLSPAEMQGAIFSKGLK